MDYGAHVEAVRREAAAFSAVLRDGDLDAKVPTCPEWQLGDLARHVGDVVVFWSHLLCQALDRDRTPFPDLPDHDVDAWFDGLTTSLGELLDKASGSTAMWTWHPDHQDAAFCARRLAHEIAVHRYDAQLTSGSPAAIEPALAADGIDEIFSMMAARERSGAAAGETLHLHAVDSGDEWMIALHPDRVDVAHEHGKADAALRGAVFDLEMTMYQRPTLGDVERLGDGSVLDAWYREFTFG